MPVLTSATPSSPTRGFKNRGIRCEKDSVAAVIVTYHPDPHDLANLVSCLLSQVRLVVIVDNGGGRAAGAGINGGNVLWFDAGTNLGVGAGLNAGIEMAAAKGAEHLLLFDQDSFPDEGMIANLMRAHNALHELGMSVAAVGPVRIDSENGVATGFVRVHLGGVERCLQADSDLPEALSRTDFLITSGCLLGLDVFRKVGAFRSDLFIDNVDVEWCYRARSLGLDCFGAFNARLLHRLGDGRFCFAGHVWAIHSPRRLYFIMRNRVLLYRLPWVTFAWKLHDIPRLIAKFILFSLLIAPRLANAVAMLHGLRDGVLGRTGHVAS